MSTPDATGLTIADWEALPEDKVIRNLIAGDLFVTPAPTTRHQRVVIEVSWRLRTFAEQSGGVVFVAPTAVRLSELDVAEPHVLYVAPAHVQRIGEQYVDGPPDLVVEVSSPSTRRLDLVRKRRWYERFGVPEYWFVDLDADRIEAYRLADGHYGPPALYERGAVLAAQVLSGFTAPVSELIVE